MSPRMVTLSPAIFPLRSRMVNVSSNACVGCSCAPSPALMTLAFKKRERKCGAPAALWRDFFYGAFADGFKRPRRVEHGGDFLGGERFDVEQMFSVPGHGSCHHAFSR